MAFSLRCPICRKKFPWPDPSKNGFPTHCQVCGEEIGHNRADDDIVLPFIRTSQATKATDKVYRDIEAGAEVRAQAAADELGVPVSEMSDLKINDLRPTTRHGDIAAPPLPPHLQNLGSFGQSQGAEFAASAHVGAEPHAGARARVSLQSHHAKLTGGAGVSDRPALETLQPGYRPRA
jgi:hypothetical protein